jgi:Transglycosylase-like domain
LTTSTTGARLRAIGAAAALLTVPATAQAAPGADDPPSPRQTALRAPIAGHVTVAGQMRAHQRSERQHRLIRTATRISRRAARAGDERRPRGYRATLRGEAPAVLRDEIARQRHKLRAARRERALERVAVPPQLQAIAACESGGNPRAIGGGGLYRGKYQFSPATWASVGGSGDPAAASEAEQDMRAALLYAQAGATSWPVCGR